MLLSSENGNVYDTMGFIVFGGNCTISFQAIAQLLSPGVLRLLRKLQVLQFCL